jgi:beta-lactam-binding protein with PASTA domain
MPEGNENETLIKELQKQIGVLRAEKFQLEKELDASSQKNLILTSENQKLGSRISQLKEEKGVLEERVMTLEKAQGELAAGQERLKAVISGLEKEKVVAQERIRTLEGEVSRPKMRPEDLTGSIKDAMAKMEEGLKVPGGRVDYTLGSLEADIKATLAVDENNTLFVKLPYLGESVAPDNLTVLRLSLKAVPKPRLPLVQVPMLVGLSKEGAMKMLTDLGLKAEVKTQPSPTPPGTVIHQSPEAYSEVPPGSAVTFTVSAPEKVKVPDLLSLDKAMALRILAGAGLEPGKMEVKLSSAPPDSVIGQNPKAGVEVERGNAVDLVISTPGIRVPNLKGRSEKEARETLEKNELAVGKVEHRDSIFEDNRVYSQSPEPGKVVLPGTGVNLVLSRKMAFSEFEQFVKKHRYAARSTLLLNKVFAAMKERNIQDAETVRDLLEKTDEEWQDLFHLKNKAEAALVKRIFQRIFEEA